MRGKRPPPFRPLNPYVHQYGMHARYTNPKGIAVNFPPTPFRRRLSSGRISIKVQRLHPNARRERAVGKPRRTINRTRKRRDVRGRFT